MKKAPTFDDMQGFAVRHTRIIDRDKIRYRVYRTSTEYIAVIAENALMAMKLSGIDAPHKIIRDLIDENTPIAQARLREAEESERVEFSLSQKDTSLESNFEYRAPKEPEAFFVPMTLGQINEEKVETQGVRAGQEIIAGIEIDPMEYARATRTDDAERMHAETEQQALPQEPAMPVEQPPAPAEEAELQPEPAQEEVVAEPVQEMEAPEPVAPPVEEALAEETPAEEAEPQEAVAAEEPVEEKAPPQEGEMPPDEVARLLAEPRD